MTSAIDTEKSMVDRFIANKILCLKFENDFEKRTVSVLNQNELGVEINEKFDCKINGDSAPFEADCIQNFKEQKKTTPGSSLDSKVKPTSDYKPGDYKPGEYKPYEPSSYKPKDYGSSKDSNKESLLQGYDNK